MSALVDDGSPYTATYPVRGLVPGESETVPTPDELRLIRRLRQAAGQGRMLLVDPASMRWWLVGSVEHGR